MTPEVGNVKPMEVTAIIEPRTKKTNPKVLSLHLTPETLQYLHQVSTHESIHGVHRVHPRTQQPTPGQQGLSRIYSGKMQGLYRYSFRDKSTYLKANGDQEAKSLASRFGQRDDQMPIAPRCLKSDDGMNAHEDEEEDAMTDIDV